MSSIVDCENVDDDLYAFDSIEECCKQGKLYNFPTTGCIEGDDILENETLLEKSDLLYNNLYSQNIYVPFTLKKTKLIDKSGWCQHQGWAQGANESDCFLDSTFFALFGNDKISVLLSRELDELYYESDEDSYIKKIVYCISVYTELLARSRPKNKPKLKTGDITIIFNETEEIYLFKQSIKWCLLWYLCLFTKDTYGVDSNEYDYIVNSLSQTIKPINLDFDGGDPIKLLTALSYVFNNIFINWNESELGLLYNDLNSEDIIDLISETLEKYSNDDIVVIPFFGPINIERSYSNFFNPKKGFLEANISGSYKHVTSITHCNTYWLEYDNIKYMSGLKTTKLHIEGINVKNKIINRINNAKTINILIFIKKESKYGVGKKTKKQKQKNKKTKNKKQQNNKTTKQKQKFK